MNKFELFLQQSNFKEVALNQAILKKLEVEPNSKTWTFFVELPSVPTPEGFDEFIDKLKLYFSIKGTIDKVDINLSIKDDSIFKQYPVTYYNWLLDKLVEKKSSYSVYKNCKVEYIDNCYNIIVDPELSKYPRMIVILKNYFNAYGLSTDIKFVTDESLVTNEAKLKLKKAKAMTEIPVIAKAEPKEPIKPARTKNYKRKFMGDKVRPIKDIPVDNYALDKHLNTQGDPSFTIEGVIIEVEVKKLKTVSLLQMTIADDEDAIVIKQFLNSDEQIAEALNYQIGGIVKAYGRVEYDTYIKDVVLMANDVSMLEKVSKKERKDTAKEKRVEFHVHTMMSNLDGITEVKDYIDQAVKWGHKAIAFTDHDGVYAYPDIYKYSKGKDIKPIYGVELNYVNEYDFKLAYDEADIDLRKATYVVFDIETTGLSAKRDKIIEISAVKIENMAITSEFNSFVNPEQKLSYFTTELTTITDADLKDAKTIDQVLPEFLDFIEGSILVAHNATFDLGHIYQKMADLGFEVKRYPAIDTMNLAKYYYSDSLKRFNLKAVAKQFKVKLDQHHRATADAYATAEIFVQMLTDLLKKNISLHSDINKEIDLEVAWKCDFPSHLILLAKNKIGYKNLFKIVSDTLTDHFSGSPILLKSTLDKYREGILIGSGCVNGLVFEAALNKTDEALEQAMKLFDYIEVQPPQAYKHLAQDLGADAEFIIESTIRKIILTAEKLNKLVIATGDVHYLNKEDHMYRDIFIRAKMVGGGLHDLAKYNEAPLVYFLTTDEMLKQFSFLGEQFAHQIVVTNTNHLNNQIDKIEAFPKTLYSLQDDAFKDSVGIPSIKVEVRRIVRENAEKLYGKNLHPIVSERIENELTNIINNEFAPIYYISHLLVKKSLEDGYLVGSRGSVGSSLVATLMNITEVNPLKPHYRCPNGDFTVFKLTDDEIAKYGITPNEQAFQSLFDGISSGYDLPNQNCPFCGAKLAKEGQDIPFETFLGFDGDKVPDIDLNFSGDYQAKAHAYVRELIGEDRAFRAGTISTIAERTAFGYVKGYLEDNNITNIRNAQVSRIAKKIEGVKRSTGQHPGGIVVVPEHKEIYDVTPVQYPADDVKSDWKTTHFDYHSIEDNLLKLDILGHDDPTIIKYLMDYVHEHPNEFPFSEAQDIPVDDKEVYKLFGSTESIGLTNDELESEVASFGLPELGTSFVRKMLNETKPMTFSGLVKISGLSHGTDVWLGNSQALISGHPEYGKIDFKDIIGCRDDIMVQLLDYGLNPSTAFDIMEFVRKGKPMIQKNQWNQYADEMRRNKVPDWYIWSCSKIKYMFPKAHAAAYVLSAVRIAWFKVYSPLLFYSAFFSKRATQFEHDILTSSVNAIRNRIKELEKINMNQLTVKEEDLLTMYYVAFEMMQRGFKFLPVDINKSQAKDCVMEGNGLRLPFVSIDGLGENAAYSIVEERNKKPFRSLEDVRERTKINKTVFENMEKGGSFSDLEEKTDIFEQGLFAL
ncbi:MAG: PolC-type DNA polymerase III [Acholeplasmataceae bacterium]|nr:PolC-type DNA polymerase III [Acholeplasmataceae bacterium]